MRDDLQNRILKLTNNNCFIYITREGRRYSTNVEMLENSSTAEKENNFCSFAKKQNKKTKKNCGLFPTISLR